MGNQFAVTGYPGVCEVVRRQSIKLEGHVKTSRSLMEPSKARTIKELLKDWDMLDRQAKNEMAGGNANYWHKTYILNAADDSLITLGATNKRVVTTDKIFDELLPVHAENQCIKGKLLFKKIKDKLASITQDVCASFCEDCPICLVQKERKKPRAGWQPLITHGMNVRGQVDLIDLQVRFSNTKQLSSGSGATLSLAPSHFSTVFEY